MKKRIKVTDEIRQRVMALVASGASQKSVAEQLAMNINTVGRIVRQQQNNKPKPEPSTKPKFIDVPMPSSIGKMMVIVGTVEQIKQMVRETW